MSFSRQFRALLKLAALFAIPWTALGVVVAIVRWATNPDIGATVPSIANWILSHALGYGALGAIAGLYLGLLLARLERSNHAEDIPLRRVALWSGLAAKDAEDKTSDAVESDETRDSTEASSWQFTAPSALAAKREAVISSVSAKLGYTLIKRTRATYWDSSKDHRAVCTLSKRYTRGNSIP